MPEETQHVPDGPLPTKAAAPTGAKFGRYQTSEQLGAGAMGTVYRARDEMLGRDVAIKSLTASGELGVRERFMREARAIGAVHHPNILAVHDVGEEGGTPYLVMELAAGGSLRDRIKGPASAPQRAQLPVEVVREVGIHIARALAAAHAANIIHRDVKPANILCATPHGHPPLWKLADFGIAHMPDSTLTMTGQFLGSPSYAAPESLRAGQFSPASDVYSLGATLYEALAGSPPHGDHDMQSLVRKLEQEAPPLSTKNPSAPRALADPIMAALATDPAKRPTAEALAQMLAAETDAVTSRAVGAAPHAIGAAPHAVGAAPAHAIGAAAGSMPAASGLPVMSPVAPAPGLPGPAPMIPATAAPTTGGPSMKWIAAGLLAIAVLAIVLAVRNRSDGTSNSAAPTGPSMLPTANDSIDEEPPPVIVDQYGNPVDEETAKQILEQMEEDARRASEHPGRGRGKKKKKDED